jgi:DNA-binding transcriptional MerR regulator
MSEVAKKKRGRPAGSANKKKATATPKYPDPQADNKDVKPGSNKPQVAKDALTDDQEHALTSHHTEAYKKALEIKKAADAKFKNVCKLAKAEGVGLKQIKEYIDYQTEEGQERLRIDLARKQKVARWAGLPVGTQLNFLEEVDRTPIDERTRHEGKTAGLKGEKCEPPRHVPANLITAWTEGWHEGQALNAGRIKQLAEAQKAEDAKDFDDALPDDEEATAE